MGFLYRSVDEAAPITPEPDPPPSGSRIDVALSTRPLSALYSSIRRRACSTIPPVVMMREFSPTRAFKMHLSMTP